MCLKGGGKHEAFFRQTCIKWCFPLRVKSADKHDGFSQLYIYIWLHMHAFVDVLQREETLPKLTNSYQCLKFVAYKIYKMHIDR